MQRTEPTYRYVSAEGPVTPRTATPEDLTAVAGRYLADDALSTYVENSLRGYGPEHLVLVELRSEHWLSADLGANRPTQPDSPRPGTGAPEGNPAAT
ncbi:hypothetical protein V2W30_37770 [Streptomyces sp. Q6]|uniref:Uncharacterized protein n=1 Tax=Streptomyces citrinus TaxID=3118173 RepID=A0ACD5AN98_9ACTN